MEGLWWLIVIHDSQLGERQREQEEGGREKERKRKEKGRKRERGREKRERERGREREKKKEKKESPEHIDYGINNIIYHPNYPKNNRAVLFFCLSLSPLPSSPSPPLPPRKSNLNNYLVCVCVCVCELRKERKALTKSLPFGTKGTNTKRERERKINPINKSDLFVLL